MAVTSWGEAKTIRLEMILGDIERGKLVLPEFQRDWKWDDARIMKLISSLLANYPAGSLMFWDAKRNTVKTRSINGAPSPSSDPQTLILDGQQRLTALWTALISDDQAASRYYIRMDEFLDAYKDNLKDDSIYEQIVVRLKRKKSRKVGIEPFPTFDEQIEQQLMPVELLGPHGKVNKWLSQWAKRHGVDEKYEDKLTDHLHDFKKYEFPIILLNETNTLASVCNIFETVNSQAVMLGPYDLLTARWYGEVELRELWKNNVPQELKDALGGDPYPILQIHSLVSTGKDALKNAKSTPSAKRPDVMDLEGDTTESNWSGVVDALNTTVRNLRNDCGWSSPSSMPYPPLLNTMVGWTFLIRSLHTKERGLAEILARRLYFAAVFTQDYDQGSTSAMGRDIKALARSIREGVELSGAVADFRKESFAQLLESESISAKAVLGGVLLMVSGAQARDFRTGGGLFDKSRITDHGVDKHHIFPEAFLKAQNEPKDRINLVANITYLRDETNRSIGKKAPSEYLREIDDMNGDVKSLLRRHAIGPDALKAMRQDDYAAFIEARARYLAEAAALLVAGSKSIEDAVLHVTA